MHIDKDVQTYSNEDEDPLLSVCVINQVEHNKLIQDEVYKMSKMW